MEIAENQPKEKMEREVKNALWVDVLTFIYTELFGKEMFEFANAFDGKGRIEIKPTDRIIDVRLEPYELLYVRLNDGMGEYLIQNRSEMISREAELKTEFVKILGKLWWHLVTLNHPKELYNKNLTLCKGYKIIEPPDLPQNPLEAIMKRFGGG
jgi:hypothetical protein